MISGDTLAAGLLQVASAAVAGYGAWRCIELQRLGDDRRLTALGAFFGLYAVAVAVLAVWTWKYSQPDVGAFRAFLDHQGNRTAEPGFPARPGFFQPRGAERINALLVAHHVLMLGSLGIAVYAFGKRRPEAVTNAAAVAGLAFVGQLLPALLAFEAGLTLYLAVRAFVNFVDRRSPMALQVAFGFGLFFTGHLLFFIQHSPGGPRVGLGDILGLVGITILVQVLPGKR